MKTDPINKTFKQVLRDFINEFFPCSNMDLRIEKAKTYDELRRVLAYNIDNIADALGYECGECDSYDSEVNQLRREISCLEEEVRGFKNGNAKTYWDEQKYLLFIAKHHKFTPVEFEKLMN